MDMVPYIQTIFANFPEEIGSARPIPHADHLFRIRDEEDAEYLPEGQARQFHNTVAQLLFLSCRAMWDIQTVVVFLTTGKVKHDLKYLKSTLHPKMRFIVDDLTCTKWQIDASHGVHWD